MPVLLWVAFWSSMMGAAGMLWRSATANSGGGAEETKAAERRLACRIAAIDIHHLSGAEIGRRR